MAEQEEHKIKKRKLSGDPVIVVGDDEEDEEDAGEEDEEGVEAVEGDDGEEALEGSEEQEAEDQEDDYSGAEEAVLKLEEAQNLIEKVNDEASERVLEVEREFNKKRRPLYLERNQIIRNIPHFWLTVFLSHNDLSALLTTEDSEVLSFLIALDVEESADIKSGYKIEFQFSPNDFFEEEALVKDYQFEDGDKVVAVLPHFKKGMTLDHFPEGSFFRWMVTSESLGGQRDEVGEIIRTELWPNPYTYYANSGIQAVEEEEYEDEGQEAEDYEEGQEYGEEDEVYEVEEGEEEEEEGEEGDVEEVPDDNSEGEEGEEEEEEGGEE